MTVDMLAGLRARHAAGNLYPAEEEGCH